MVVRLVDAATPLLESKTVKVPRLTVLVVLQETSLSSDLPGTPLGVTWTQTLPAVDHS